MLKTFVLLATVWHAPSESPRIHDVYVIDSNLSGEDCTNAILQGIDYEGFTIDLQGAIFSCELDTEHDF